MILTSNVLRRFGDGTILLLTLVNPLSLFRRKTYKYNIKKTVWGIQFEAHLPMKQNNPFCIISIYIELF